MNLCFAQQINSKNVTSRNLNNSQFVSIDFCLLRCKTRHILNMRCSFSHTVEFSDICSRQLVRKARQFLLFLLKLVEISKIFFSQLEYKGYTNPGIFLIFVSLSESMGEQAYIYIRTYSEYTIQFRCSLVYLCFKVGRDLITSSYLNENVQKII